MKKRLLSLLCVVFLAMSVFVGCGDEGTKNPSEPKKDEVDKTDEAEKTDVTETVDGTETEGVPEETIYSLGDTVETDQFSLQIISFDFVDKIKNGRDVTKPSGNTNVVTGQADLLPASGYAIAEIKWELKNIGKQAYNNGAVWTMFQLDYNDGYMFKYEYNIFHNFNKQGFDKAKVLGDSVYGSTYIFVPEEVKNNTSNALVINANLPSTGEPELKKFKVR